MCINHTCWLACAGASPGPVTNRQGCLLRVVGGRRTSGLLPAEVQPSGLSWPGASLAGMEAGKRCQKLTKRRSRHIAHQSLGAHDGAEGEGHQSQEECQPYTIWDRRGTCPESQCQHPDPTVVSVRQQAPSSSSVIFTETGDSWLHPPPQ